MLPNYIMDKIVSFLNNKQALNAFNFSILLIPLITITRSILIDGNTLSDTMMSASSYLLSFAVARSV